MIYQGNLQGTRHLAVGQVVRLWELDIPSVLAFAERPFVGD